MKCLLAAAIVAALTPSFAAAADYSPIDCRKAATPAETTVCKTYSLGQAEARMATLYGIVMSLVAMGQRGDIGDDQQQWLKTRAACGRNVPCLTKVYGDRIQKLDAVMTDIASRGPF